MEGAIQNHNSLCRIATRTYYVKGIARKIDRLERRCLRCLSDLPGSASLPDKLLAAQEGWKPRVSTLQVTRSAQQNTRDRQRWVEPRSSAGKRRFATPVCFELSQ